VTGGRGDAEEPPEGAAGRPGRGPAGTISLIERGDYSPSVTLALTLAKICGVTVEDIFSLEEENHETK